MPPKRKKTPASNKVQKSKRKQPSDDEDSDDQDEDQDEVQEEDEFESVTRSTPRAGVPRAGKGKSKTKASRSKKTKASPGKSKVEDLDQINWLKIGEQANEIVNIPKACLWPGFVDRNVGNPGKTKLVPMTDEQMGLEAINNFFILNMTGQIGKKSASYVAQIEEWKRVNKQGGGVEVKSASRGWIALKGYYKFVGFAYSRVKYIIEISMDHDLTDVNLAHWEKLLTPEGRRLICDLFPGIKNVWEAALAKSGGSMTTPTLPQFQEAAEEGYQGYINHHTFAFFLVPPRGNPSFEKVNLRTEPEIWAKVALLTLLCTRGENNDEDIGNLMRDLEKGDSVYGRNSITSLSSYFFICPHMSSYFFICLHMSSYFFICLHIMSSYVFIFLHMSSYHVFICLHISSYFFIFLHMSSGDEISANAEAFGRVLFHYGLKSLTCREDLQNMPYKSWSCHRKINRTRLHVTKERATISAEDQTKCDEALVELIKTILPHSVLAVEGEDCEETEAPSVAADDDDNMFA